eukprot:SAG25_NODE_338_length_9538_cov_22.622630_3_plen_67_part_00
MAHLANFCRVFHPTTVVAWCTMLCVGLAPKVGPADDMRPSIASQRYYYSYSRMLLPAGRPGSESIC